MAESSNKMFSRIPTATFDTRRSPVRSPGRSPSTSPAKSPGQRAPGNSRVPSPSRRLSPGGTGQSSPQAQSSNIALSSSQGHLSRSLKQIGGRGASKSQSPLRPGHGSKVVTKKLGQSPGKSPGKASEKSPYGDHGQGQTGVRYITDDMIRKVTKQDRIEFITTLNLTLAKEGGRKIKYIENLDRLKRIQVLNLSCNVIEKIEKLEKLTTLRELNLSYNSISKLEGLETLVSLQVLNITGNNLEHVPQWLGKKLKCLRSLKLAKNDIQSIQEFTKLRPLKDLVQLTVAENPVSQLPHCRSFLVFHLRTLENLDSQPISTQERTAAHNRFAQEEIEKLESQLEQQQQQYNKLRDDHNKSLGEIESKNSKARTAKEQNKANMDKMMELQRMLETKEQLLKRKTSELTKACEKHYELEQELAFYKIDHKFGELSKPPLPATSDSDAGLTDDGLIGAESPYIGKGRFQKSEYMRRKRQRVHTGDELADMDAHDGKGAYLMDLESKAELNETMDKELAEKHDAIERAQEKLHLLQTDLQLTTDHLQQATEELHRISEAAPARPLTEDDKQDLRNILDRKMIKVHHLRGEAVKIQDEMQNAQDDLDLQEQEVSHLRGKLKRMGSRDSLYSLVKKEVAEKERRLNLTAQQYAELQHQLEGMIHTIARETEDIKKLEQDLRDGQISRNDELRNELEGIVAGLQGYLSDVQLKANKQKQDYDRLFKEKLQLEERIIDADDERLQMEQQADEISLLREKLSAVEESMQDYQDMNESLRAHLDESRIREKDDGVKTEKLHDAEDRIEHLKKAMREIEKKAMVDKEIQVKKLEAEQKKLDQVKSRAREVNMKEDEIRNLHNQLTNLQVANAGLQDQIYGMSEKLKEERGKSVNPDLLRGRLEDMARLLGTRGRHGNRNPDDGGADNPVEMIDDLHGEIQNKLDQSFKEVERAKRDRDNAEIEVITLKDKVVQVQGRERDRAEMAIQAMMDEERDEAERLRRQIDRLRAELERERELKRERALIPTHLLEPSTRPSHHQPSTTITTTTATGTTTTTESSEEETSTIPSSQWSQKKRDIYDMMSPEEQELFDELQKEIEELRKLLLMKGSSKDAMKKATQAAQTVALLRDMIETRQGSSGKDTKLSRSAVSGDRTGQQEAALVARAAKSSGDPNMRMLGAELDNAQEEVEHLHEMLRKKNHQVKGEMVRSDRSQFTIAAQKQEIDQLHAILEEQKNELGHLTHLADHGKHPGPSHPDHMDGLPDPLDSRVAPEHYGPRGIMTDTRRGPTQHAPGRGDITAAPHYDRAGRPLPTHEMAAPYSGNQVADNYADRTMPGGRPVPVFYSPDGQEVPYHDDEYYGHAGAAPVQGYDGTAGYGPGGSVYPPGRMIQQSGVDPPVMAAHPGMGPYVQGGGGLQPINAGTQGYGMAGVPGANVGTQSIMGQGGAAHGFQGQSVAGTMPGTQVPGAQVSGPGFVAGADTAGGFQQGVVGQGMHGGPAGLQGPGGAPGIMMAPGINNGFTPGMVGQAGVPMPAGGLAQPAVFPTTPQGRGTQEMYNPGLLTNTPVAGPGMGTVLSGPNTPGAVMAQPMMMSTPLAGGTAGVVDSPIKGILKKAGGISAVGGIGDDEGELLCNVPEHHDLEDYVSTMQQKIRKLKSMLKNSQDLSSEDGKHVLFEEDIEKQMIKRLQGELEERRQDLEGLDLAIERQKTHLHKMNKKERNLQAKRDDAKRELQKCRKRSSDHKVERRKFLDGDYDLSVSDSDLEYDYIPSSGYRGRKDYIKQEVICLEETLGRRRAELRAADRLLAECDLDLSDARHEAKSTVHRYQEARSSVSNTRHDAQELEERAYNAGVKLIKAEEALDIVTAEVTELRDEKAQHDKMLSDIEKVISSKDTEFRSLDAKIKQSTQRLHDLQFDLHSTEGQQREHLDMMKESDQLVAAKRHELDQILHQIASERHNHETLNRLIEQEQSALKSLEDSVRKRQIQLDSLDRDITTEVNVKHRELKDIDSELVGLRNSRQQLDIELKQVRQNLHHEEDVLQNVTALVNKRKQEVVTAEDLLHKYTPQLKSLKSELTLKREQQQEVGKKLREEEAELDRLKLESRKRASEIDSLHRKALTERDDIESLRDKKRNLEESVSSLQKDKGFLEDKTKDIQKKIAEMKRAHVQVEESVRSGQRKLSSLEQEIQYIEDTLNSATRERSSLDKDMKNLHSSTQDGRMELQDLQSNINEAEYTVRHLDQAIMEKERKKQERELELVSLDGQIHPLKQVLTSNLSQAQCLDLELAQKQSELKHISDNIEALKREAERLGRTAGKFSSLDERVKHLAEDIIKREEEKHQLSVALDRSVQDLHELRRQLKQEREEMGHRIRHLEADDRGFRQELKDRNKELQEIRTKTSNEIADLEGIAQAHCSRASRLSDELNYLRAEYLEVKRQLDSQQEIAEREKRLEETIKDLKSDIKFEVTDSLLEREKQKEETMSGMTNSLNQREDLATHLANIKQSLALIRSEDSGIHTSSESLRESLVERQNFLKNQLEQKMLRQSEFMQAQRQISNENLLQLKQKLSTIEQVYSQAEHPTIDSLDPEQNQTRDLVSMTTSDGDKTSSQESSSSGKDPPKRAYSPHRYSNSRSQRHMTSSHVPEKDFSS